MGLLKIKSFYRVGKKAAPDKFLKTFTKQANSTWIFAYDNTKALVDGAVDSFHAGRPENVQTALANADTLESHFYPNLVPSILLKISDSSNDALIDMNRALEKVPEHKRTSLLSAALKTSVCLSMGGEPFLVMLFKSGASFDDALSLMHAQDASISQVANLKFFQEKITGIKPAEEKTAPAPQQLDRFQRLDEETLAEVKKLPDSSILTTLFNFSTRQQEKYVTNEAGKIFPAKPVNFSDLEDGIVDAMREKFDALAEKAKPEQPKPAKILLRAKNTQD